MHPSPTRPSTAKQPGWKSLAAKYQTPTAWKSSWQLANSLIPFLILWYLMVLSLEAGYWLTLLLSIPTAGFMEKCHDENPMFQNTVILTLRSSLKSTFLSLWDEEQKKLISFNQLKQRRLELARIS